MCPSVLLLSSTLYGRIHSVKAARVLTIMSVLSEHDLNCRAEQEKPTWKHGKQKRKGKVDLKRTEE